MFLFCCCLTTSTIQNSTIRQARAVGLFLVSQGALLLTNHFEQETKITPVSFKGIYCQDCGAGNTEESVFCRACGSELAYAVQVVVPQAQEVTQ